MVRRRSVLGLIVALGPIAALTYFAAYFGALAQFYVDSTFLFLVAIVAVIFGGAIARSGKAGAVVGFLAVWIPTFAVPLILLLTIGESGAGSGFAVIVVVILAIGLMVASFLFGAFGALIGGVAGYLSGRKWPLKVELTNVSIPMAEDEYLKRQAVSNHMLRPDEGDEGGK